MTVDEHSLDPKIAALGPDDSPPPPPGPELEALLANSKPARPRRPRRQLAIMAGASLLYAVGLVLLTSVRRDMVDLPRWWVVVYVGGWLVAFVMLSGMALLPAKGNVLPRCRIAGFTGIVFALAFPIIGLIFARHVPGKSIMYEPEVGNIIDYSRWCLRLGLITAVVPILLATLVFRRALPVGSRWWAAAIGAAGGCLGGLMLHLHCPIAERFHLGLVHGGIVVLGAVLAALIVPRFVRP